MRPQSRQDVISDAVKELLGRSSVLCGKLVDYLNEAMI